MTAKKILLLLLTLAGTGVVHAERLAQLAIYAMDGTKVSYVLRQQPKITFENEAISITSDEIDVIYPRKDIARFEYEHINTAGIINLSTGDKSIEIVDNAIVFPFLKENSNVCLYTVNGQILFQKRNIPEGQYMFSLSNITPGVYALTVNSLTYKVILR